jgi:hypothetical protein
MKVSFHILGNSPFSNTCTKLKSLVSDSSKVCVLFFIISFDIKSIDEDLPFNNFSLQGFFKGEGVLPFNLVFQPLDSLIHYYRGMVTDSVKKVYTLHCVINVFLIIRPK